MKKLFGILCLLLVLSFSCSKSDEAELPPEPPQKSWTVAFNSNGGSDVSPIGNVKNGTTIDKPSDPAKDKFVFNGWYTDNESFANAWVFAESRVVSDTVLYAKWVINEEELTWTVAFNSNGGSDVSPIGNVKNGTTIDNPADPTKEKYGFEGWYADNETFANAWVFTESKVVSDTVLYAKWVINEEELTWTVAFDSNGGSDVSPIGNVKNGTTIDKPADPTKDKFVFEGWYADNETFANIWDFAESKVVSDTVLYAKWKVNTWTVTFNSNGGNDIAPLLNIETGAIISKPGDPVKNNLQFGGWYTDNESFANAWDFASYRIVSDTVLHAKWNAEPAPMGRYNNLAGQKADCADPYVLKYDGAYYLYGTGGNDGIKVYRSNNAVNWGAAIGATDGYALHKNDVWGEKWFWAPEVYYINGKFYMFYSAEEHISVAESSSPLGPFTQTEAQKKPFHANIKEIDTHLFIDDDGKKYLYFVRFTNGNEIWMAELNDNLHSIKETTLKKCLTANSSGWENSTLEPRAKVNEGPFVLKHNGWYYLTYSANHYENPNYGVGYATSRYPQGPWTKFSGNPVLIGDNQIQGVGHHSFITLAEGCQYVIYHSHKSVGTVQPRKVGIDPYEFLPSGNSATPDRLRIYGPTTTTQNLCRDR
jgi:uncharacterized repeat protein (TIGR02543 family)